MHQSFQFLRKSAISALCVFSLIFAGVPTGGCASSLTAKTTDYLNLRQSPGTNSKVLATLGKNVSLTVMDNSNPQWAKVKTSAGKIGYCCKQYLNFPGTVSTPSVSSGSTKSTACVLQNLNMRVSPALNGKITAILAKGSTVTVLDNSNAQWAKVQTQSGKQGWCYKLYLKISASAASASSTASSGSSGTSGTATAVTTDYLNLRSGAGSSYKVITVLGKGITASVLDNSNSLWVKVLTRDGRQGWCSRQYLKVSGSAAQDTAASSGTGSSSGSSSSSSQSNSSSQQTSNQNTDSTAVTGAKVTADLLRLRQSASTSGAVIDNLPCGTVLKVLDTSVSGWVKVQTSGGKTGYVSADYVKLLYGGDTGSSGTPASSGAVTISESSQSLPQGKTLNLQATASNGGTITWSSSNTAVATVENGLVYAVAPGTSQITAQSGSDSVSCSVTVTDAEPVRTAYASPNIAVPGDTVTFKAVTDNSRDGAQFAVMMPDGSTNIVRADNCTQETTNGITAKIWTGTASFTSPGTYSFTAYSSLDNVMSTTGYSSSTMVSTQSDFTVSTNENRRASDKMLGLIAKWEGSSSTVYFDSLAASHVATIGYGCTVGKNDTFYNNLSPTEEWSQLVNKVNNNSYTTELNKMIKLNNFQMSQNQADCLISFAYNVGPKYFNSTEEMDFRRIMKNAVIPPDIPSGSSIQATVTHDTQVRQNSGMMSSVACQATAGTTVSVLGCDFADKKDGWYQVQLSNGVTGWVNSGYINLSNSGSLTHDLNYTNAYAFGTELIRWNQAGGKFYAGLFYRRLGEANVYNYNDYDAIKFNKYGYGYPSSASSLN